MTIDKQNQVLFERLCAAEPCLVGLQPARDAIPALHDDLYLHAGPPIVWQNMSAAMQAAIAGAINFEGRAATVAEALDLAGSGRLSYAPAHSHCAAGAMAGIISPTMPVFVVEERVSGVRSFVSINEGFGKALRFGANDSDVIQRLRWIRDEFAPLLAKAIEIAKPLPLKPLVAEALRRGDECHNRNKAATSAFFKEIAPALVMTKAPHDTIRQAMSFIAGNDHFFLSLSIAHAKAVTLAMEKIGGGSLVTTIAGNGHEVGIKLSRDGSRWFTAPAEVANVKLFAGQNIDDATPMMGDSYVTETIGLGGFALAAAPAIAEFVGGTVEELAQRSERMRKITVGSHAHFVIPQLGFSGVPSGIDVRRVVTTGIAPIVNTGVASRRPGIGQIGAGIQTIPLACFQAAFAELQKSSAAA